VIRCFSLFTLPREKGSRNKVAVPTISSNH
jgi:hypothetical protein